MILTNIFSRVLFASQQFKNPGMKIFFNGEKNIWKNVTQNFGKKWKNWLEIFVCSWQLSWMGDKCTEKNNVYQSGRNASKKYQKEKIIIKNVITVARKGPLLTMSRMKWKDNIVRNMFPYNRKRKRRKGEKEKSGERERKMERKVINQSVHKCWWIIRKLCWL